MKHIINILVVAVFVSLFISTGDSGAGQSKYLMEDFNEIFKDKCFADTPNQLPDSVLIGGTLVECDMDMQDVVNKFLNMSLSMQDEDADDMVTIILALPIMLPKDQFIEKFRPFVDEASLQTASYTQEFVEECYHTEYSETEKAALYNATLEEALFGVEGAYPIYVKTWEKVHNVSD